MLSRLASAAAAGAALLLAACSSGGGPAANDELTRVTEAGGVTVTATWLTGEGVRTIETDLTRYPLSEFALVELTLDTHSDDLSQIDMERAAALRQGGAAVRPLAWVTVSDDTHHRSGVLVFPRGLENAPTELTLKIENEEIVLLWEEAVLTG